LIAGHADAQASRLQASRLQATRQGWPYYIRFARLIVGERLRGTGERRVYSRAIPISVT